MKQGSRLWTSSSVRLLGLHGFHEVFGKGVVIRVAFAGHADIDFVVFEYVSLQHGVVEFFYHTSISSSKFRRSVLADMIFLYDIINGFF